MGTESIVTIFAICVPGLVSILGVLVPAYLTWRKLEQEHITAKIDRIHAKAENLSHCLAEFRNIDYLKAEKKDTEARIKLRASHDAWEMVVFLWLTQDQRDEVREMRKSKYGIKYLTGSTNDEVNIMGLIDNVVEFSCSAVERLNKSEPNNESWFYKIFE